MKRITIIGANTFLGEHLITAIDNKYQDFDKNIWNYNEKLEGLEGAIQGSDMVFNLHELQDMSLMPNKIKLIKNNVEFVSELLSYCKMANVSVLVHLSSTYLQCSTKWPNIYGRESDDFKQKESPFDEYCKSKFMAEQLLRDNLDSKISIIIARVGPLYGEGDRRSLVCDTLLLNRYFGFVPRIGKNEDMGVLQFTYVGNAAFFLLKVGEKLLYSSENYLCETVIICDDTPLRDFYTLIIGGMYDLQEEQMAIPFLIFFWPYLFLCWVIQMFSSFHFNSALNKFPSPNLFYLLLRHWTFYSGYKLRVFFDLKPLYDWETCLRRSRLYYTNLKPENIVGPSWLSPID